MKTIFAFFCKFLLFPITNFFTKEIIGKENIPWTNGFILVANHANGLDHWFIGNVLRKRMQDLRFIGAMDNLKLFLQSGLLYYFSDTIIINRKKVDRKSILEKMAECLKNDKIIVIYPEGDSNPKRELLRGKTGAVELALKTGFPIVPVGMAKARGFGKRIIKIGKPLYFLEEQQFLKETGQNQKEYNLLLRKITDQVMREISNLCSKPYLY